MLSAESERRILVGHQREGVAVHAVTPPQDANHVAEKTARIGAGEENRKPGNDDGSNGANSEEEENKVMRDGEEPLDQRQPAVHLASVGICKVEVNRLLF